MARALHIFTAANVRVRRKCPFHKRLCYGNRQEYYDTVRIFFDCGTMADYGYGEWTPPPKKRRDAKGRFQVPE